MTGNPEPPEGNTFGTRFTGRTELKEPIVRAMKTVFDPEIPVDIYELGLIYRVDVDEAGLAKIDMTLTSPMCPSAEALPAEVQRKVAALEGIADAKVDIVWDPPWSQDFMSEAARVQLGFF
jgi:FeS assembly SUF system protein